MTGVVQPLYVYGAGRMGREVLAHLRAGGIEPDAFVDRAAARLRRVDGIAVVDADAPSIDPARSSIVVAVHSPGVDVAAIVDDCRRRGYRSVRTLWDLCAADGWRPASAFWLHPAVDREAHGDAIERVRRLWGDDASRRVFDEQLALRRGGDYAALSAPTPLDQYLPSGLPRWRTPMRLLDCGAYDGDTLRALRAAGYAIDDYVALEPDRSNFAELTIRHGSEPNGRRLRVGAHDFDGELRFDAGGGSAARVDDAGNERIEVRRIDGLCDAFHPTLIKMDIEGSERQALAGAARTIERDVPDLAISVYHRVDDLWQIPLSIDALGLGYRFHVRSHAYNGFETVLYAFVR